MVAVVQLVEHQVVILAVAGSSPVSHPEQVGGRIRSPTFCILKTSRTLIATLGVRCKTECHSGHCELSCFDLVARTDLAKTASWRSALDFPHG